MNINAFSKVITVSYLVVSSCILVHWPQQGLFLTLKNLVKISFRFRLFLDLYRVSNSESRQLLKELKLLDLEVSLESSSEESKYFAMTQ